MLGSTAFAIGTAWTLNKGIHVRVDILYSRLSHKIQGLVDIVLSLILFFPFIIMTFIYSIKGAAFSWSTSERIISGYWNPPIYPLKTIIAIAYGLLLIQGMAGFVRTVYRLRGEDL
jgi:TRAP-type mannitol/chloroaromatic compound transport system permease small subunit